MRIRSPGGFHDDVMVSHLLVLLWGSFLILVTTYRTGDRPESSVRADPFLQSYLWSHRYSGFGNSGVCHAERTHSG